MKPRRQLRRMQASMRTRWKAIRNAHRVISHCTRCTRKALPAVSPAAAVPPATRQQVSIASTANAALGTRHMQVIVVMNYWA